MPLAATAWKFLAQRELQARLRSEAKNQRLYAEINARTALMQDFHHRLVGTDNASFDETRIQHKRIRVEPIDAEVYHAFVQKLDGIYATMDKVLSARGVDAIEEDWGDGRELWQQDDETGSFVMANKQVLSIDFQHVRQTLWKVVQMPHHQDDRNVFDGVDDPERTAAFKFCVRTRLNSGQEVSIVQRCANRLYEETDRLIVVWRTFVEGGGQFAGMHADETGWIELTPSATGGTFIRTCVYHVPMHLTHVATQQEPAVDQFTGMVLKSVSDDGDEITKRFGDLQLAEE